jgi:hypothetical protein
MKMVKMRWVVVIFVLLGFLLIGTESPAIHPDLDILLRKVPSTVCVKNTKKLTLTKVTLEAVTAWYDKEWRAVYQPIRTWYNLGQDQEVCTNVSPGTYRVKYEFPGRGIEIGYTPPKVVEMRQKVVFYIY